MAGGAPPPLCCRGATVRDAAPRGAVTVHTGRGEHGRGPRRAGGGGGGQARPAAPARPRGGTGTDGNPTTKKHWRHRGGAGLSREGRPEGGQRTSDRRSVAARHTRVQRASHATPQLPRVVPTHLRHRVGGVAGQTVAPWGTAARNRPRPGRRARAGAACSVVSWRSPAGRAEPVDGGTLSGPAGSATTRGVGRAAHDVERSDTAANVSATTPDP